MLKVDSPYIIILEDFAYRVNQKEKLVRRITESGYGTKILKSKPDSPIFGFPEFVRNNPPPEAVIRWEENGGLYGSMRAYIALARWCHENEIAPIAVDFALFDHYGGFTFDLLNKDGRSGIDRDWLKLPTTIDYDEIPGGAGHHIRTIRSIYAEERENPPKHENYSTVAFLQAELRRCNLQTKGNSLNEWIESLYEIFKEKIIFKLAPSPTLRDVIFPNDARHIGRQRFSALEDLVRFNSELAIHGDYVVTNSSGVTNEFLVTDIPVVVTGKSFYEGKSVFKEVREWKEFRHPQGWKPEINHIARAKYTNWFLQHQCLHGESSVVLQDLLEKFNNGK